MVVSRVPIALVIKFHCHLASGLTVRMNIMMGVFAQCVDVKNLKALVLD